MNPLNILFITTWYPTEKNPVNGVFIREHAKAVKLYNNILVFHIAGFKPNIKKLWEVIEETDQSLTESIPTYRVWCLPSPIPKTRFILYLYSIIKSFKYILSKGFYPDIIHAHIFEAGVPAILIGKIYKIPVVITEQSTIFSRKLLNNIDLFKSKIAFSLSKIVLPVSNSLKKAIEQYKIKANFKVIPNVVDTTLFYPSPDKNPNNILKKLLFVGLLDASHKKGIPFLFQALVKLKINRIDWHLDIIGDGPARKEYEEMAIRLGIGEKVSFHGLKSKKEVAEFMRNSDLFVLPSLFETFSVVTAEALATGIPVLVTSCGGPEEFIKEGIGLVVPRGDSEVLYKGLDYMLNNLGKYDQYHISRYAYTLFNPENVGKQLQKIYLECITKYKG